MIDLLRLCRLYYSIPMSFIHALTVCYALGDAVVTQWASTMLSTLALAMVISAGYVLNDVRDSLVDRINAPHRPVAANKVGVRLATVWGVGLLVGGFVVALLCRWQFLAVLSVVAGALVVYSLFSKRLGPGKQLFVALLMTSIYPLAFAQAGEFTGRRAGTLAVFPVWLFLTSFGYETLKDICDIKGDRAVTGRASWVQCFGRVSKWLSATAVVAGAFLLVGPYMLGCTWVYLVIVSVAIMLAVASALVNARRALVLIYAECVVVGIAATADIIVWGL